MPAGVMRCPGCAGEIGASHATCPNCGHARGYSRPERLAGLAFVLSELRGGRLRVQQTALVTNRVKRALQLTNITSRLAELRGRGFRVGALGDDSDDA